MVYYATMAPILIVYTTTTGNTQYVAELLQQAFPAGTTELMQLAQLDQLSIKLCKAMVCCVSTWGRGEMQDDWDLSASRITSLCLDGLPFAVLGLGDQRTYPERFADGAGILVDALLASGGVLYGKTATGGYSFVASKAMRDNRFVGLMIDEDNQHPLTADRIASWVRQLQKEFP